MMHVKRRAANSGASIPCGEALQQGVPQVVVSTFLEVDCSAVKINQSNCWTGHRL
jgi:hypothetical protein